MFHVSLSSPQTQQIEICDCVQFVYMLLVGTFPFNGFLAGFLCSLGFFALAGAKSWHAQHCMATTLRARLYLS